MINAADPKASDFLLKKRATIQTLYIATSAVDPIEGTDVTFGTFATLSWKPDGSLKLLDTLNGGYIKMSIDRTSQTAVIRSASLGQFNMKCGYDILDSEMLHQ